ncbi:MAG TPA: hypothetical protein VFU99_05610, partial [Gaiellaceae bacterium]|nr:hypothetical protein [Gaiellaceae bacterium]
MQPFRDEPLDDGDWPKAVAVVGNAATPNPVRRVAVVGVLAVLAAAVVAASSSDLLSRLRGEVPALSIRGGGGVFMAALLTMMLLAVVGLGYLSWVERAPRRRGGEGPVLEEARPQRWIDWWPALLLPLLVVSLITLLLALGELFGRP